MCKMLKINAKLLTMYHSEIDDQIEKVNAKSVVELELSQVEKSQLNSILNSS